MRCALIVVSVVSMGLAAAPAPTASSALQGPDKARILSDARTVAVVGVTGRQMMDRLWANPNGQRAKLKVEEVLVAWGRYQLVQEPTEADLVLVVTEFQKNINVFKLANLVATLEVYRGNQEITEATAPIWSGDASEGFRKLPATKVAEDFTEFVAKLTKSHPQPATATSPPASEDRPAAKTDSGTDELLLRLPSGIDIKWGALPYSLLFSPNRRVAYIARYRDGEAMNEAVMLGDVRGVEGSFVNQAALSPDGLRVAYLVSLRVDPLATHLVVGNRRDQVQFSRGAAQGTDSHWVPVFSPDGRKLAYKAETASGKHAIRVADVSEIPPDTHGSSGYTELAYQSGPEFDDVDEPVFSDDGAHVTYAARNGRTWAIVVDGTPGPFFRDAATPVLDRDGRTVAFRATRDDKKYFVVVGGQEGPSFDRVSRMAFSPDGATVAYGAQDGNNFFVVIGGERRRVAHLPDEVVFSADGRQVASWAIESRGRRKERLIVNDTAGPEFEKVGRPVFDASARVAAYWVRDKDKFLMVAGDRRSERFEGVGRTRVFSADGSEVGFGVLRGNELRWVVMKTH